jgi:hypothetical protein
MCTRIFGWIGIVWGGAIVVTKLLDTGSGAGGGGASAAGQSAALVLGFLLLVVGAYYAFRKPKA